MAKKRKRKYTKKEKNIEKIYLPFEFGDLKGLNGNLTFHLNKKYKGEKKTLKEWENILSELE